MFNPIVSIVIPVYNGANYMKKAIDSALNQTYKNVEIVVVNDGSNDNNRTNQIAMEYGDKIIYINRTENKGIAETLNEGIAKAKGEYIAWLSHDDMYLPTKIEEQINYLNDIFLQHGSVDKNKVCLCGGSETIDKNDKVIRRRKMQKKSKRIRSRRQLLLDNMKNYGIGGCTVLIPKEAFEKVGGFDNNWKTVQDANMWFRLILKGYSFCYLNKRLVQSRAHEEEFGRKVIHLFKKEIEEFYFWLSKEMLAYNDLCDLKFITYCAVYNRMWNRKKASKFLFVEAKRKSNFFQYLLFCVPLYAYGCVYGELREFIKKLYWKFIVKK